MVQDKHYHPETLREMLANVKARKAKAEAIDPQSLMYAEKDVQMLQEQGIALYKILQNMGKFGEPSCIGQPSFSRTYGNAIGHELDQIIQRAEEKRNNIKNEMTSVKPLEARIVQLETALKDRARLESKMRGWLGIFGGAFGSDTKWNKAEYELVESLLARATNTGVCSSVAGREHFDGEVLPKIKADALAALTRWRDENEIDGGWGYATIKIKKDGSNGELTGHEVRRLLIRRDDHKETHVRDDCAKPLRVWGLSLAEIKKVLWGVSYSEGDLAFESGVRGTLAVPCRIF